MTDNKNQSETEENSGQHIRHFVEANAARIARAILDMKGEGALPELFGDYDDSFVDGLRTIKEQFSLPDGAEVVYPGSGTHVGVARVFGAENVTHVDPEDTVCQALTEGGYLATPLPIEAFVPNMPMDVMIALNSYGSPTEDMLERTVKPGGLIVANNYTGWARELAKLEGLSLEGALMPSYMAADARLVEAELVPPDATDFKEVYMKTIEEDGRVMIKVGTVQDHTFADTQPIYPDALFVFRRTPAA